MTQFSSFFDTHSAQARRAGRVVNYVMDNPPWVYSITFAVGFVVLIIPVVLLILAGIAAIGFMAATFYLLAAVHRIVRWITGTGKADNSQTMHPASHDGRDNVRIVNYSVTDPQSDDN